VDRSLGLSMEKRLKNSFCSGAIAKRVSSQFKQRKPSLQEPLNMDYLTKKIGKYKICIILNF